MTKIIESISYIKIGNVEHPIDAVTVGGKTIPGQSQLIPNVSSQDNGKMLIVTNGVWSLSDPGDLYDTYNGITCGDEIDYVNSYLTLDVLSSGTIKWNAFDLESTGTPLTLSIQYSINGGDWTTATSSTSGVTINVSAGDEVRVKGSNNMYATTNKLYSGFGGHTGAASTGTAEFNVYGNIMSLIYGDDFAGHTTFPSGSSYNFCCLFDGANVVSAENLILPATTLRSHCYRAMFANCPTMIAAPVLPATTLSASCYRFMFQNCSFTTAPELPAVVVPNSAYYGMFSGCSNVNYIKCLARDISAEHAVDQWVQNVAVSGTFIKDVNMNDWVVNSINGIPVGWTVTTEGEVINVTSPTVTFENNTITLSCSESGTTIYYRLGTTGDYQVYSAPISITETTTVQAYSRKNYVNSSTVSQTCTYVAPIVVADPVISCENNTVTITCSTTGATIYYKLGSEGQYQVYSVPVEISDDVTVYAYASLSGTDSTVISQSCQYVTPYDPGESEDSDSEGSEPVEPPHDYSLDYLTFDILTNGTILWDAEGSNATKTIEYSINDGAWTSVTSNTSGVAINVTAGDSVRFRGSNTQYCNANKSNYSRFGAGTATFNISGNIMSMTNGDNFAGVTTLPAAWTFTQFFKESKPVSAENLILPATTMLESCYRALFSKCTTLVTPPALPATTLASYCYYYMFENCAITTAPDLLAATIPSYGYAYMFTGCSSLNYIKCMATTKSASNCLTNWVNNVAPSGTFVKDANTSWTLNSISGVPVGWTVFNNEVIEDPVITFNGEDKITIICATTGADIYYRLGTTGSYSLYSNVIVINADTTVYAYSSKNDQQSSIVSQSCTYSEHIYTFGGLRFSQGPLYYGSNGYEIKDSWNYTSYGSVYGKSTGSTHFNFLEMGELFEKSGFTTSDGDIENMLDPFDGWRLPSQTEIENILGTTRPGSTVNNIQNQRYTTIIIDDVAHCGNYGIVDGILIFPDGETITTSTGTSSTLSGLELEEYISQGCVFLPASGTYTKQYDVWEDGDSVVMCLTNNADYIDDSGCITFGLIGGLVDIDLGGDKTNDYYSVRLVKNIDYGDESPFEGANKDINNWNI